LHDVYIGWSAQRYPLPERKAAGTASIISAANKIYRASYAELASGKCLHSGGKWPTSLRLLIHFPAVNDPLSGG